MQEVNPTEAELAEIFSARRESAEAVAKIFVTFEPAAWAEDLLDN
ncbi:hypothetical protein [Actinoplanes sp. NBRC 103695]|nr:hypothetical protein [Actinoplanes sp. NBRC 103695]GLZ02281.1 hypothetical protein Acsp02_95320 [Actinoplanes sp. NBRC 103695]